MDNWQDYVKIESPKKKGFGDFEKPATSSLPIQIGHSIVVDGHVKGKKTAVFTHFHVDHIADIDFVAGEDYDKILMHDITHKVMVALKSTRKFNKNICPIGYGENHTHTTKLGEKITLYDADHIPGSCQVFVEVDNKKILYSGDFVFPSASTPKCDILVLDANHGIPQWNTKTEKGSVLRSSFVEIKQKILDRKPVVVTASRGSLQEIMHILDKGIPEDAEITYPDGVREELTTLPENALVSETGFLDEEVRFIAKQKEITILKAIYDNETWQSSRQLIPYDTPEAYRIMKNKEPCLIFQQALHKDPELANMYTVMADRYSGFKEAPMSEHDVVKGGGKIDKVLRIDLHSHGNYDGIIDYVNECKPEIIITDASRSGYAKVLAEDITDKFGKTAAPRPR